MALTRDKKAEIVDEISKLLSESKLTVFATYQGTSVKSLQELRRSSRDSGTVIVVVKNRLFRKALESNDKYKNVDLGVLKGQLMYAFNPSDEVAPAQNLASFAKSEPQIQFIGALSDDGLLLNADDVKALANLPSKNQLRAQLVGTIAAPISGFVNVMAGNVRGLLNVLNSRADSMGN